MQETRKQNSQEETSDLRIIPRRIFTLDNKKETIDLSKNLIIKQFLEKRQSNPISLDEFDNYLVFDSVKNGFEDKRSFVSYLDEYDSSISKFP